MSLIYKCDFYGTTEEDPAKFPFKREKPFLGETINGVTVDINMTVELSIPTTSETIHVSPAAWKDAAQIIKAWFDATFP